MIIRIEGKLLWKWGRTKRGAYIAVCDPIAQTLQADRFSELLESINEALDSTFRELLSTGELHKFLRARRWPRTTGTAGHFSPSRRSVPWRSPKITGVACCIVGGCLIGGQHDNNRTTQPS